MKINKTLILFIILSAVALAVVLSVKTYDDSRRSVSHSGIFVKGEELYGC